MSIHHKSEKFVHFHIAVPPAAMSPVGHGTKQKVEVVAVTVCLDRDMASCDSAASTILVAVLLV